MEISGDELTKKINSGKKFPGKKFLEATWLKSLHAQDLL